MLLVLLLLGVSVARAQFDPLFKPGSIGQPKPLVIAPAGDGKVYVGGNFNFFHGTYTSGGLIRVLPDGTVDPTFDPTLDTTAPSAWSVEALAVQPDGKVLVTGEVRDSSGNSSGYGVGRRNADGTVDATYTGSPRSKSEIPVLAALPEGKALIAGNFTKIDTTTRNRVARLNADGTLDETFDPGTGPNAEVLGAIPVEGGRVLIFGKFTSISATPRRYLARLKSDGSLDPSFDISTGPDGVIDSVAVQADGRLLVGGKFSNFAGAPRTRLARLLADGTLDDSLTSGMASEVGTTVNALAVQADGTIWAGGTFQTYASASRYGLVRLQSNGSLDADFSPGSGTYDFSTTAFGPITRILPGVDGQALIAGSFGVYSGEKVPSLIQLRSDGSLDPSYLVGTGLNGNVYCSAQQYDSKILVGGAFTRVGEVSRPRIARLNYDGTLDPTFNPGTGANGSVRCIAVLRDGKSLVGGDFTTINGISRRGVARLNANGSVDETFDPGTAASGSVRAFALQPDGRILVAGGFTAFQDTTRGGLVRLNSDGTLDAFFDPGTFTSPTSSEGPGICALALQTDGKILAGGNFSLTQGTTRSSLVRLNANGSFDSTFRDAPVYSTAVKCLALQPDGKILVGGQSLAFPGGGTGLQRLQSDGNSDYTFSRTVAAQWDVRAIGLQASGRIHVGGDFYSSTGVNYAQINSNGTRVNISPASINLDAGPIHSIAQQRDGRALLGGEFISTFWYNSCSFLARVNLTSSPVQVITTGDSGEITWLRTGSLAEVVDAAFELSTDAGGTWQPLGSGTRLANNTGWQITGLSLPPAGRIRARGHQSVPNLADIESIFAYDRSSQVFLSPTANSAQRNPVQISLNLPEPAVASGVRMYFGVNQYVFKSSVETAGEHTFTFDPTKPTVDSEVLAGSALADGVYPVTLTYTVAGQTTLTTTHSNVRIDTTAPQIAPHADVEAEANTAGGANVTYEPAQATDVGTPSPALTYSHASGSFFPLGETTVTVTATDAAGNETNSTFSVTVRDTTAPKLGSDPLSGSSEIPTYSAEALGPDGAAVVFLSGAISRRVTDIADPHPTITFSPPSGTLFPLGRTDITVTMRDASGNAATFETYIDVTDHTAPVLTVPEAITTPATSAAGAAVTFALSAADLVDGAVSATSQPASGSTFPVGLTTVTATSVDAAGNSGTKTFTVTVTPSSNAALASLAVAEGTLAPFDPEVTGLYGVTVGHEVTSATVVATPAFAGATIVQTPANPVPLAEGENAVQVAVTAQDGTTTRTYSLKIRRTVADAKKPGVKITAPGNKVTTGTFTASGSVAETIGLATLTLKLNDGAALPVPFISDTGKTIAWSLDGLEPDNGPNTLTVTATDYNGNVGVAVKTFSYTDPDVASRAGICQAVLVAIGSPSASTIGLVKITLGATGSFTGQIRQPGLQRSFSGVVRSSGEASFKLKSDYAESLALGGAAGELRFIFDDAASAIVGQISAATFQALPAPYSAKNKVPAQPPASFLNLPAANPARGYYTARIYQPTPAPGSAPGHGYATVKLSNTGSITVAGRLPDGAKLSASSLLRADGTAPIFTPLYDQAGGFGATLELAHLVGGGGSTAAPESGGQGPVQALVFRLSGTDLAWIRPALPSDPYFPAGWPTGLALEIDGAHWPTEGDGAPLDFAQGPSAPTTTGNATLEFGNPTWPSAVSKPVDLNPDTGRVTLVRPIGESKPGYTFKASATTGLFSGTFQLQGKSVLYQGAFVVPATAGPGPVGLGYFLSRSTGTAGSAIFVP